MRRRWRDGPRRLAVAVAMVGSAGLLTVGLVAGREGTTDSWQLVVRSGDAVVSRVPLPDGRFALRYRNSVYGSLAEERFAIASDGRVTLVALAADEAAVLGEYYTADAVRSAEPGDGRRWVAAPLDPVALDVLPLAATEHGQRTLLVEGRPPIALWELAGGDDPGLTLVAEAAP